MTGLVKLLLIQPCSDVNVADVVVGGGDPGFVGYNRNKKAARLLPRAAPCALSSYDPAVFSTATLKT